MPPSVSTSRISWVAYATEDSGSLAKIGRAMRLGRVASPSRSLRTGRPTTTRFVTRVSRDTPRSYGGPLGPPVRPSRHPYSTHSPAAGRADARQPVYRHPRAEQSVTSGVGVAGLVLTRDSAVGPALACGGLVRTPAVDLYHARVHELHSMEELLDLRAAAGHHRRGGVAEQVRDLARLRVAFGAHVRKGQVAAGRQGVPQPSHDAGRILLVGYEVEDGHEQDRDRLLEVDPTFRRCSPQDRVGVTQVALDRQGSVADCQQSPRVHQHDRVVVDVDHPGLRRHPLGDLVDIALSRQTRTNIQELPDTRRTRQEPHYAPQEGPSLTNPVPCVRRNLEHRFRKLAIDLVVVLAAEKVVV